MQEVGWSQRHFIAQFKHEIGVPPKVFARMLRFGRVVRAIRADPSADLADLAIASGYYDQSHLSRPDVVRAYFDTLQQGQFDLLGALFADDVR